MRSREFDLHPRGLARPVNHRILQYGVATFVGDRGDRANEGAHRGLLPLRYGRAFADAENPVRSRPARDHADLIVNCNRKRTSSERDAPAPRRTQ